MSNTSFKIWAFLKFGKKEHMEDLLYNGTIYMNTIEFFRKQENLFRGDKNEVCNLHHQNNGNNKLFINDKQINFISVTTMEKYPEDATHLYCLNMFGDKHNCFASNKVYDERNNQFGDYLIYIHNIQKFLELAKKQLIKNSVNYELGPVCYIDKNKYSGEMGAFRKFNEYSYQNEYRFMINQPDKTNEPIKFNLGNLEDIAMISKISNCRNIVVRSKNRFEARL